MATDQLNSDRRKNMPCSSATATPAEIAQAVLAVLSGTPLDQVAAEKDIESADLADACQTYQQAGLAALEAHAEHDWYQVSLELPTGDSVEHTMTAILAPRLQQLQDTGDITAWWFIRKTPGLRVRITPGNTAAAVEPVLDELVTSGALASWRRTRYEPEAMAFGGQPGMAIAHKLFSADSHHILAYLRQSQPAIGRRELSILLCTAMFRGAGQEWFECGDIWHRVSQTRPKPADVASSAELATQLATLLTHDPRPAGPLFGNEGPLTAFAPWANAFHDAGCVLATAGNDGTLHRGIRSVLAHHVIFHWNRLGLTLPTQTILAHTAAGVIAGSEVV
ncbi:thiopeptide-type bacteriocin biosynthesis protein [Saccharopolyspora phatthalungensis]|uniref:Thiopeptide-type bacteriocin biosynthesis protein n=1 Tax=Saccharopolyspora phatthalungensis TaxID=664693 RepID=A0A840Q663_9PSEU|nr:thiopeptide-type bacteriocin biosynthesis protein [Saccharopolyspora phatthalungensis]MBB5155956.1 thiopeptide-type bacteriocin biosynthesis protein [Saccharopolyspora phatthalungensis]